MAWTKRFVVGLIVATIGLAAGRPATAQPAAPAFQCTAATLGQVSCQAAKLCTCIFDPGGSAVSRPAGYRWDCGILRPQCGPGFDGRVDVDRPGFRYPDTVIVDGSDDGVTIENSNTNTNTNTNSSSSIGIDLTTP